MIVSHKHKFIYIKAFKTASSSVLHALAQQCGKDDTVFTPQELRSKHNYQRNSNGLHIHSGAHLIKSVVGKDIWNSYTKVTITRNPWDCLISMYWFNRRNIKRKLKRNEFLSDFRRCVTKTHFAKPFNRCFYFWNRYHPVADIYLRFENLQDDYNKVCRKLKLTPSKLPRLKSGFRKSKLHYSKYYDNASREAVEKLWEWEIEFFSYRFEDSPCPTGGSSVRVPRGRGRLA